MAGGGIKPGLTYGATDELGFHLAENPVHVHDMQATILHPWASTTRNSPTTTPAATSA